MAITSKLELAIVSFSDIVYQHWVSNTTMQAIKQSNSLDHESMHHTIVLFWEYQTVHGNLSTTNYKHIDIMT